MLRAAVQAGTKIGRAAKECMDRGELVSDAIVIGVARERLSAKDAQAGFILDGFPRTVVQAQALDAMLKELGQPLERCVAITIDEEVLVERLLKRAEIEGRADDNEATIRNRMRVYREQTEPLLAYYGDQGLLCEVDGVGSVEEVASRIEVALD